MNIANENIKALRAGGTELTKLMDKRTGLSKIIQELEIKKKGLELEKITLSLVSARIDEPKSVLQSVEDIKNTSSALLQFDIDPEDVHERTYYRGLEKLGKYDEEIYSGLIDSTGKEFDLDLSIIFADWTSTFFYGTKCKLAKPGFSRDHRPDKKQIKIGLAMSDEQSIPFYYSVEKGDIVDVKQFKKDFEGFKHRLPEGALIVFNKGAKSKKNCDMITDDGYHYLTAVKDYNWVGEKIRSINRAEMRYVMDYKKGKKVFVYREEINGVYRYFYYDERRAEQDAKKREEKIKQALAEKKEMMDLLKKKGVKALKRKLTKRKKISKELNDTIVTTQITIQKRLWKKSDKEIIAELEKDKDLDGFYVLESSKGLSPKDALQIYRRKDKVEKLVSDLKSVHQIRPFRVWTENAVRGAVLICMIATLFIGLAQQIVGLVKKAKKTITDKLKSLTLVIELDDFGRVVSRKYANMTDFLAKLLGLSFG